MDATISISCMTRPPKTLPSGLASLGNTISVISACDSRTVLTGSMIEASPLLSRPQHIILGIDYDASKSPTKARQPFSTNFQKLVFSGNISPDHPLLSVFRDQRSRQRNRLFQISQPGKRQESDFRRHLQE